MNSDVFSTPAARTAATCNTRTATSNSLHRHSRRRKKDGETAFMITCYHSARIAVTPAHRSLQDIITGETRDFRFYFQFLNHPKDHVIVRHVARRKLLPYVTVEDFRWVYILFLSTQNNTLVVTVGSIQKPKQNNCYRVTRTAAGSDCALRAPYRFCKKHHTYTQTI